MDNLFRGSPYILILATIMAFWACPGQVAFCAEQRQPVTRGEDPIEMLDLKTAAKMAIADNPSLAAARARVEQARQAVRQARSGYWPRVDVTASQDRVDASDAQHQSQVALSRAVGGGNLPSNPDSRYRAGLTFNWLIFDGFSRWFKLAAAKHGTESSNAAQDDAQRLLLQAVSSAFLSAQLSLENVAIAKADKSFNQRQLKEAKLRHKVGTGALSDVLNFQVKANSAESDLIVAKRAYETARIGLATLLGIERARLPENLRLVPLDPVSETELQGPPLVQSLKYALEYRPDLRQNASGVLQAEAAAKARRGEYFPTFSFVASWNSESNDSFEFGDEDLTSSIGVNMSFNLFAGGLTHAQHQQAKMQLLEARKRDQDVRINVTAEVETTTERVLSAQKQLVLQRTNAKLVKKNRNLVEKEYKAGVGSLVRLNEAQRDLTAAQVRLATAQVALRRAWYDYWSATGEIKGKLVP